ncbi:hypothetical protein Pelo_19640 [Pelomyxa schiedti]|nr:hypothetical protein Pelo_19640 [Pelomyxa schiedti]
MSISKRLMNPWQIAQHICTRSAQVSSFCSAKFDRATGIPLTSVPVCVGNTLRTTKVLPPLLFPFTDYYTFIVQWHSMHI